MSLTPECIKEKFMQFDTSGDGKLTYDEFREHIRELLKVNVSDAACHNVFDSVNKGSDDYITIDEWMNALDRKSLKDVGEKELKETFAQCDVSGDGKINKCELKKVLASLQCKVTDEQIDELFAEVDSSGDGSINVDEFTQAFYREMEE